MWRRSEDEMVSDMLPFRRGVMLTRTAPMTRLKKVSIIFGVPLRMRAISAAMNAQPASKPMHFLNRSLLRSLCCSSGVSACCGSSSDDTAIHDLSDDLDDASYASRRTAGNAKLCPTSMPLMSSMVSE